TIRHDACPPERDARVKPAHDGVTGLFQRPHAVLLRRDHVAARSVLNLEPEIAFAMVAAQRHDRDARHPPPLRLLLLLSGDVGRRRRGRCRCGDGRAVRKPDESGEPERRRRDDRNALAHALPLSGMVTALALAYNTRMPTQASDNT